MIRADGEIMKRWIVKHITHREMRDLHRDILGIVETLGPSTVLDIAPPHIIDMSKHMKAEYSSIGLTGKHNGFKHDLNITPYPVPSTCYDLVIMSNVLEHLENPFKAACEAVRISKRWVLFCLPVICTPETKPMGHRFSYKMIPSTMRRHGKYFPMFVRDLLVNAGFARNMFMLIDKKARA